jgi:hypothetical protein
MKALTAPAPIKKIGVGSSASLELGAFTSVATVTISATSSGAAANTAKVISTARKS